MTASSVSSYSIAGPGLVRVREACTVETSRSAQALGIDRARPLASDRRVDRCQPGATDEEDREEIAREEIAREEVSGEEGDEQDRDDQKGRSRSRPALSTRRERLRLRPGCDVGND